MTYRLFALLSVIGFLMISFTSPAYAVGLKNNSMVSDTTITLGDVFYDLPRDADRVLGAAPRPGEEMVLNARTLLRIARAMDLSWRPSSTTDHVVIRSDATLIDHDMIRSHLRDALSDQNVFGDYDITLPVQYHQITLPAQYAAEMEVTRVHYDQNTQRFEAIIAAPSAENPVQQMHVRGTIEPVIQVPVVTENVQNGRIIRASDIEYITIRENTFNQKTIADAQSLIGMTARRVLIAGRPIKDGDIVAPQMISRGEIVTLALLSGTMNITTQVKALQNGARGEVIRVVNLSSNKTMQARVESAGRVVVE